MYALALILLRIFLRREEFIIPSSLSLKQGMPKVLDRRICEDYFEGMFKDQANDPFEKIYLKYIVRVGDVKCDIEQM